MFTPEGRRQFGRLLREHRLNHSLWPESLYQWFETKGGFIENDKLTRFMLIEWFSVEMNWPDLNTLAYERKYGRVEQWADLRSDRQQNYSIDPVLLVTFERSRFLSLKGEGDERIPISDVFTMVRILRGELNPDTPRSL